MTLAFKVHQFSLQLHVINGAIAKLLFRPFNSLLKQRKMIAFSNKQLFIIKRIKTYAHGSFI